ncbi:hypothetical protein HGRIS_000876 [Hohenbuehelia grisea]|uniref:Major facilitator superfamily (MFS) profile domain-containing protein n=3 Tax=Hohenbuehelia grisea TaxID=104357 RepID=A0ABR3IQ12_9AGAR
MLCAHSVLVYDGDACKRVFLSAPSAPRWLTQASQISNTTAPSIALPTIGRELNIPEAQLQWIVSAYSLTSGCLLLFFGRIADLYGRKSVFMWGTFWLAAFTLGCGFSNDAVTLDMLRGLQGIGAAATIPASLGILAHSFPPSRARSIAFATFAAGAPVGAGLGSVIGGVLTQLTAKTWRATFYLSTGLTVLNLLMGAFSIDADQPSTETDRRVDWLGALLVTAGLTLIIFVLGQGEVAPQQWKTPYIIVLLVLGVLLMAAFVFWQDYLVKAREELKTTRTWLHPPPLMKLTIWTRARGRVAAILCIILLNWCSFLGWNFWLQLYYQQYLELSPIRTTIRLLPMFITGVLCNVVVALVVGHVPVVYLLGLGTSMTAAAALLFALVVPSASYWAFGFPAAVLSVFGADFMFASGTIFIARAALPHEQSVAGALFQTMTQVGTAIGVSVTTVVFNRVIHHRAEEAGVSPALPGHLIPKDVALPAYKAAQWTAFAFGVIAFIVSITCFWNVGVVGHRKDEAADDAERTFTGSPAPSR